MIIIHGKRTANIKTFTDYQHACNDCKDFGMEITVSQQYYHLYYIPFTPIGYKVVYMRCIHCGTPERNDEQERNYAAKARTPFYYYSIPLVIIALILFVFVANRMGQAQKAERVAHPQKGDVYLIREEGDRPQYYFLKIMALQGDTVKVFHNKLVYPRYTSELFGGDYFVTTDTLNYTRKELINMQQESKINMVKRAQ